MIEGQKTKPIKPKKSHLKANLTQFEAIFWRWKASLVTWLTRYMVAWDKRFGGRGRGRAIGAWRPAEFHLLGAQELWLVGGDFLCFFSLQSAAQRLHNELRPGLCRNSMCDSLRV